MTRLDKNRAFALILAFFLLTGVLQAFGAEANVNDTNVPLIGKDVTTIEFSRADASKRFHVWNAGTGVLNYSLDIDGNDADYFSLDDSAGESNGVNEQNSHTVFIDEDLPDTTLYARIVITNDDNDADIAYINITAPVADTNEPNTPTSSPAIGQSTGRIALAGNVLSKRFQIWNKGSGTINYTLELGGGDADYFTLNKEDGNSSGVDDKKTHTVSVAYPDDFHNQILDANITITDDNDNSATIILTATETIATRVSFIGIEQSFNYDTDSNEVLLYVYTDGTVEEVNFTTPQGEEFTIDGVEVDETPDGNLLYWTYLDEDANLSDYGDGRYTIAVVYNDDDGSTAPTTVNFGIPNKPGTIPTPTQTPVLINPEYGMQTVSPVRLEWEKCTDPNAGAIRLYLENEEAESYLSKQYSKATTKTSAIDLAIGDWDAWLYFGRWYQADNNDGIEFEVGKCTGGYSNFEIMKWFGIQEDETNHTLKLADSNGNEITFKLTGGGFGEISDNGFDEITLTGTTEKSVLSITTKRGVKTNVGIINADGDIKAIKARSVNLDGDILIAGGAGSITLSDVNGARTINIGSSESPKLAACSLNFNQIEDLTLTSDTPIRGLKATSWQAGDLQAPWISTITIKGDFGANMTLDGGQPKAMTLKSAKFAGNISGVWSIIDGNCGSITFASSTGDFDANITGDVGTIKAAGNKKTEIPSVLSGIWQFSSVKTITAANIEQGNISATQQAIEGKPAIGKITVKEWITGSDITVTTDGNIGSISAGAIQDCSFSTTGSIGKIANKGIKNETYCFINSFISAQHIGAATLGYVKYNNDGDTFDLTAEIIDKLTIKDSVSKQTWTDVEIGVDGITIGDLEIKRPE